VLSELRKHPSDDVPGAGPEGRARSALEYFYHVDFAHTISLVGWRKKMEASSFLCFGADYIRLPLECQPGNINIEYQTDM
jgi:hypothetical protein